VIDGTYLLMRCGCLAEKTTAHMRAFALTHSHLSRARRRTPLRAAVGSEIISDMRAASTHTHHRLTRQISRQTGESDDIAAQHMAAASRQHGVSTYSSQQKLSRSRFDASAMASNGMAWRGRCDGVAQRVRRASHRHRAAKTLMCVQKHGA